MMKTSRRYLLSTCVAASMMFALTALTGRAEATIVSVSSNVPVSVAPPPPGTTVDGNFLVEGGLNPAIAFNEQQNVLLANPLITDTGIIDAGTSVDSHYIAFNSALPREQSTTITFSGPVLGIVYYTPELYSSSEFLGLNTVVYDDDCPACQYEPSNTASFSGNQVFLDSVFWRPGDFARIITAATPVPEPASLLTLIAGLAGLSWVRYRRRNHPA